MDAKGFPGFETMVHPLGSPLIGKTSTSGSLGCSLLAQSEFDTSTDTLRWPFTRLLELLCAGDLGVGPLRTYLVGSKYPSGPIHYVYPTAAELGKATASKNAAAACAKILGS